MSTTDDVLVFNTNELVKPPEIQPLPLYDDSYHMLGQVMPEYTDPLPNYNMSSAIASMKMTMKLFSGLGLSANQCGVQLRVFLMGSGDQFIVCINPKVLAHSDEVERGKEGCLSYPGMFLSVPRYKWIDVEYTREDGEVVQERFTGLTARVFLHELDHMNGVRFVEHVGPLAIKMAKDKQKKLTKKISRKVKNERLAARV